jgi:GrpB-like predicted nucleotidyltransferase (UPF0157 family)/mannose-6-phosphate isomerase-like protein (cupin superfamily)
MTGERIVFRTTAAETGGRVLEMDAFWTRPGHRTPEHVHPEMQESWRIIAGGPRFRIGDTERTAGPGEVMVAEAGVAHMAWNPRSVPVHVRIQMRPALGWETFIERLFALEAEMQGDGRRGLDPAMLLELLREFPREVALAPFERSRGGESTSARTAAGEDLARAGGVDAPVEIVAYDTAWPASFEAERKRIAPLLEGATIHHFGSTAVPGLAAKPVIDMIALTADLDAPIAALVSEAGYQFPEAFNATLAHRRFLCYPAASHRTHHLHLVDRPEELRLRLRFRDRLRADPALAAEYEALKRALAERHRDDREAYTDAKAAFVKRWSAPAAAS